MRYITPKHWFCAKTSDFTPKCSVLGRKGCISPQTTPSLGWRTAFHPQMLLFWGREDAFHPKMLHFRAQMPCFTPNGSFFGLR